MTNGVYGWCCDQDAVALLSSREMGHAKSCVVCAEVLKAPLKNLGYIDSG